MGDHQDTPPPPSPCPGCVSPWGGLAHTWGNVFLGGETPSQGPPLYRGARGADGDSPGTRPWGGRVPLRGTRGSPGDPRGQILGEEELRPFALSSPVRERWRDAPGMGERMDTGRTDTPWKDGHAGRRDPVPPRSLCLWVLGEDTQGAGVGGEPRSHLADGRPLPLASAAPRPRGAPLPAAGVNLPGCSLPLPRGALTPLGCVGPGGTPQHPPRLPVRANWGQKTPPPGLGDAVTTFGDSQLEDRMVPEGRIWRVRESRLHHGDGFGDTGVTRWGMEPGGSCRAKHRPRGLRCRLAWGLPGRSSPEGAG